MAVKRGNSGKNTLKGTATNDTLEGLAGNDTLYGKNGDDYLDGGSGIDRLEGGNGNDTYIVDNSGDVIVENGTGLDLVNAYVSWTLGSNLEGLFLRGNNAINGTGNTQNNAIYGNTANNVLNGKAGNDYLTGSEGNDTLVGDVGNDTLTGDAGSDMLTGGGGADYFNFYDPTQGVDRIVDFSVADDTIGISSYGFINGGLQPRAALTAEQFHIGVSAADGSDRVIYNRTTGGLFFDADGTGATAQVQIATLSTGLAMTNTDIYVLD
jgi:Ca2+-binding RTX toxin-like protein